MELRTYTGLWNVEKRLYKFYDISLPYPVSVKQIGILIGAAIPWLFLMSTLGVPFAPPFGHILWLAPPVALAWWGNKPVAEGKNLPDYIQSQLSYYLGHRNYTALTPNPKNGTRHTVTVHTWAPTQRPDRADINTNIMQPSGKG